jgi:hypothetical protein
VTVGIQLLYQLFLVVLVDVGYLLALQLLITLALDSSECNLAGVGKPNCLVFVLEELALHPKDFDVMQLGQEISHFVALFHAVFELVVLD